MAHSRIQVYVQIMMFRSILWNRKAKLMGASLEQSHANQCVLLSAWIQLHYHSFAQPVYEPKAGHQLATELVDSGGR